GQVVAQNAAGKTQEYYSDLQETLQIRLARLGETLKQVGVQIFESGLGEFLKLLASSLGGIASVFSFVLTAFTAMDEALGGTISKFIGWAAAIALVVKAVSLASSGVKALTAATVANTAATGANSTAQVANQAAQGGGFR